MSFWLSKREKKLLKDEKNFILKELRTAIDLLLYLLPSLQLLSSSCPQTGEEDAGPSLTRSSLRSHPVNHVCSSLTRCLQHQQPQGMLAQHWLSVLNQDACSAAKSTSSHSALPLFAEPKLTSSSFPPGSCFPEMFVCFLFLFLISTPFYLLLQFYWQQNQST